MRGDTNAPSGPVTYHVGCSHERTSHLHVPPLMGFPIMTPITSQDEAHRAGLVLMGFPGSSFVTFCAIWQVAGGSVQA